MTASSVVVGTDGSEESLRAVEWAAIEAVWHRALLRIVSAPAMPSRMCPCDTFSQEVGSALRDVSARALDEAIARAAEVTNGLLIGTDLLAGPPAAAVSGSGAGALMLVVGARGAGGFTAMLLGSVSRYSAAHASCPVIVVRPEYRAVTGEVAVGLRDPDDTSRTLAFAFEEAALRDAALVAVHSCYSLPAALGGPAGSKGAADAEHASADVSRELADALGRWQDKYPAVPLRLDVMHGHPARILASYSERADLVVIGRRGGQGTGPAIGAIRHAVLCHARGPVAVVPVED